jgi:hypothetical protein
MHLPSLSIDHWYETRWHELKEAIHGTSVEQELHSDAPVDGPGYMRLRDRASDLEQEIENAVVEKHILQQAIANNLFRWTLAAQQRYGGTRKHYELGFSPSWESFEEEEEEEVDA